MIGNYREEEGKGGERRETEGNKGKRRMFLEIARKWCLIPLSFCSRRDASELC